MQSIIDVILEKCRNKTVVILGFGKEGKSTLQLCKKLMPTQSFIIADKNPASFQEYAGDGNLSFISGENYIDMISDADIIIKSPGIPMKDLAKYVGKIEITSQTDLFLMACSEQIIGITGTKGKSTTSTLLYHVVKSWNDNTIFVGNIGIPPFDMIQQINDQTTIICEFSSHQLELINKSPHIAVLLNIFQEHLDHYNSYADYQSAKFNIAAFQQKEDYFIYCIDNEAINNNINKIEDKGRQIPISMGRTETTGVFHEENKIILRSENTEELIMTADHPRKLKGKHNLYNIMAVIAVSRILQIPAGHIRDEIQKFQPLEHRMEYVGRFGNIDFYNDSISTIPESTIEAIKTIHDIDTIILGGYDRGIDYQILADYILTTSIKNIFLLGEAGRRIESLLLKTDDPDRNIAHVNAFADLKGLICLNTKPGMACLLSPAASSYDMFANFEERGRAFKKMAKECDPLA